MRQEQQTQLYPAIHPGAVVDLVEIEGTSIDIC